VDDFLYQDNVIYRQYLDEKQYPYEYHESAGGHSWKNWMDYLTLFAQRLF
jgi:enterochelin esterase family protein